MIDLARGVWNEEEKGVVGQGVPKDSVTAPRRCSPENVADGGILKDMAPDIEDTSSVSFATLAQKPSISGRQRSWTDLEQLKAGSQVSVPSPCLTDFELEHEGMDPEGQMELALIQGELEAQRRELEREQRFQEELCSCIAGLDWTLLSEKDKARAELESARGKMEAAQRSFGEAERSSEEQPRCGPKEQPQEEAEDLEVAQKIFEELEFQWLERLSSLEEERETQNRKLQEELSLSQKREADREERVRSLDEQLEQIKEQVDRDRRQRKALGTDKDATSRSEKYSSTADVSGMPLEGPNRTKQPVGIVRMSRELLAREARSDQSDDTPSVFSITQIAATRTVLRERAICGNSSGSLPRRRHASYGARDLSRPASLHEQGLSHAPMQLLSLVTLHRSQSFQQEKLPCSSSPHGNPRLNQLPDRQRPRTESSDKLSRSTSLRSNGCSLQTLVEMESKLRAAVAEKQRLLQAKEAHRKEQVINPEADRDRQQAERSAPSDRLRRPSDPENSQCVHQAPIAQPTFDLRAHIEASGHAVEGCRHLTLTGRSCRGRLTKMGGRIKTWRKRWFVFDIDRKWLAYFTDKEETKLKGVIYFQALEEIYFDHLRRAPKALLHGRSDRRHAPDLDGGHPHSCRGPCSVLRNAPTTRD
ncbi:pleckstrin homology-like domain family B member 3 isoform X2 [Stegostoma tigrinum]|uniref:pleckstrin homology-like domain family B member 3 isoform X2 n=1 Tax=Stegostoma tigrinum TaxID=3053191 RepID=UPI00287005A3|nr:pleckstrin homology-like domain family B member 3 isoform X2 [Stegostoma tigrinum]